MLLTVDASRGVVCFSAEADDPSLTSLLESDEVVATAYLDSIKVQFDIEGLVLVHGGRHSALNAEYPKTVYRFQRRDAFRVKPFSSHSPQAQFRHPGMPDMPLTLRILDVSLGGMALFLPESIPMIEAGSKIGRCIVDLDGDTRIEAGMAIHHVTVLHPEYHGARLGCEFSAWTAAPCARSSTTSTRRKSGARPCPRTKPDDSVTPSSFQGAVADSIGA